MKKKIFFSKYLNVLEPIKEEEEEEIYDEKMLDEDINFVYNSESESEFEYKSESGSGSEYESSENIYSKFCYYLCLNVCYYFNCFNM